MSLHIAKLFSRPLALASAALVIHIGTAPAADSTSGDAQAAARQVLLGPSHANVAGASRKTEPQERPAARGDAQAAARQLLLSQRRASDAPATGETQPQKRPVAYGAQAAAR